MQFQLMQISQALKPGEAIQISREMMYEATKGDLSSLFDTVRPDDTEKFARKIEKNWGIKMIHNFEKDYWTMSKPA